MNYYLYLSLIILFQILFVILLLLLPITIIKFIKRKNRYVYSTKAFLYFGYFCAISFCLILVDGFYLENINYKLKNTRYLMFFMLIIALLGVASLWFWIRYEIKICDDKLIYRRFLKRKSVIRFNEIDIENSYDLFIYPKNKRNYGNEVLKLKMKNGNIYNIKLNLLLEAGDDLTLINLIKFKLKIKSKIIYDKVSRNRV